MSTISRLSLTALLLIAACDPPAPTPAPTPTPAPAAPVAPPAAAVAAPAPAAGAPALDPAQAAAVDRAKAAAKVFAGALKEELGAAVAAGGPPAGVEACVDAAPRQTAAQGAAAGVKLGRSALRLRSPANRGPDWVQAGLQAWGERKHEGVQPQISVHTDDQGEVVRVLLPIAVEAQCTACHGDRAAQPPALQAALAAKYPADQAVGFAAGDLRGGLWVEAPVLR
jgi:hypothetical protein